MRALKSYGSGCIIKVIWDQPHMQRFPHWFASDRMMWQLKLTTDRSK